MEMLKQCRKNAMRLGEEALAADQDAGTMSTMDISKMIQRFHMIMSHA
jgi:hypothetical protein